MSEAPPPIPYTLHIWPSKWNLPSFDPTCLAAVLYLQLTIPGKFKVVECADPDLSSNGQLPFLTHGHVCVPTLPAIISFVTALSKSSPALSVSDIDASLNTSEKAKRTAWSSHVDTDVGDLVSHMFYSLDANFWGLTNPTLASVLPIPQRYYVPGRIRESYRPRLEASGLWNLPGIEQEKKSPFDDKEKKKTDPKETFARVFEREKVSEKARSTLSIYSRLLGDKSFFFGATPTTLDVSLAAHILLLLDAPFPDPLIQTILKDSYPTIVDHARRVHGEAASRCPRYEMGATEHQPLLSIIPRPLSKNPKDKSALDPEDARYRRMRWMWVAVAVGGVAYYLTQLTRTLMRAQIILQQRAEAHRRHEASLRQAAEEEQEEEDQEEGEQEEGEEILYEEASDESN
ncbi:hypothetical protein BV22DRAFT_1029111 [Leucogyrophana mollusca]|uniref:Uncharacterized protein n=1 Tax=Leucogyrophana mollusca TaxID=85980 RepID=A0ACB8BUR7_9AGAM|nr:hypothetical protein BV22DRAFT_1029111 [Leucogyrophana mollusca]